MNIVIDTDVQQNRQRPLTYTYKQCVSKMKVKVEFMTTRVFLKDGLSEPWIINGSAYYSINVVVGLLFFYSSHR